VFRLDPGPPHGVHRHLRANPVSPNFSVPQETLTTVTRSAKGDKSTSDRRTSPPEGRGMPNKIEIRPLDKKETTGDSGGNGGS
jgi:hypothetical protein